VKPILPPIATLAHDADQATRQRMYEEYKAELYRLNPHLRNPDGSRTRWMGLWGVLFGERTNGGD
jgi:hypothetical protein